MQYHVYILQSIADHGFYVGMTKNIPARLEKHNHGKVTSTKKRRPFTLVFSESLPDSKTARVREKYWKSGIGRKKIREMIGNSWTAGLSAY